MGNDLLVLEIARSVERLVIVAAYAASLAMGWDLFRSGIMLDQSATFQGRGLSIQLRRVAPGVFFALFGAIGLIFSTHSALQINQAAIPSNTPSSSSVSWVGSGHQVDELMMALNTVKMFGSEPANAINPIERQAINKSLIVLSNERDLLLKASFPDSYDRFSKLAGDSSAAQRLAPEDRAMFQKFMSLSTQTFVNAPTE